MKKILSILSAAAIISFIAALVFLPSKSSSQKEANKTLASSIPDSVNNILKKSCVPCHSKGGSKMAAMVLNFTQWDQYSPKKQIKLSSKITKTLVKDDMPPSSFRKSKPDAVPTKEQIKIIMAWAATYKAK